MDSTQIADLIKLIWPIIAIQFGLQIYALIDLFKKKKTKSLSVPAWAIIIIIGEILGPIAYLIFGKSEE